jgi:acetyl-CoA acyltransferase
MTINRFCASGTQAIALAADRIRLGETEVMIAGGTESMSMVPMGGNKPSFSPAIFESNENIAIAYGMGITAEKVAQQWNITREQQDMFAAESHRRALRATDSGEFKDEITPYNIVEHMPDLATREIAVKQRAAATDEGPRRDTTPEGLAKLRPAFAVKGTVTAGNSSQMSDGAAAVVLMSEAAMKRYNLSPLGRFMGYAVAGVPPEIMGIGPVKAIPKVLEQAGLKLDDIDWIELNEAFAAQSLAVIKDLGLDPARINPLGGAIALGHPLGATGAVRAATLMHGMRRHKKKYGMITMCIGTGMGAAGVFEAL